MMLDPIRNPPGEGFRDRSRRLAFFGILAILSGAVCAALALFQLALPFLAALLPPSVNVPTDFRSVAMGSLLYGLLGGALIRAGIGSIQRRKWVRPIMLMLAWTWLLVGSLAGVFVWFMLDDLLRVAAPEVELLPAAAATAIRLLILGVAAGGGILLPGLFVWAYQGSEVRRTCEIHDPAAARTDRCPPAVLSLSAALGFAALLVLPMCFKPVVPFFGVLIDGWTGSLLLLVGAAATGYVAYSTYRLRVGGWWATISLLVVLGVSVVATFLRVEPAEYYRRMGYPEQQLALFAQSSTLLRNLIIWGTILITALSLAYMAGIRKHFGPGSDPG